MTRTSRKNARPDQRPRAANGDLLGYCPGCCCMVHMTIRDGIHQDHPGWLKRCTSCGRDLCRGCLPDGSGDACKWCLKQLAYSACT